MMNSTMQRQRALGAYRNVEGIGAPPESFMKMALDAARGMLQRAETAIDNHDKIGKAKALASAANVVEFMLGLAGFAPGELSECLSGVYKYVLAAILKGNAGDDKEAVAAARVALDELAATWRAMFPDMSGLEASGPYAIPGGRQDRA
jgi:flagellar biosynthetic protein FliS